MTSRVHTGGHALVGPQRRPFRTMAGSGQRGVAEIAWVELVAVGPSAYGESAPGLSNAEPHPSANEEAT
jgi:hypothetical protein